MVAKFYRGIFLLFILNSIYLSYVYLEAFMLGNQGKKLINSYIFPLISIPFIFLIIHLTHITKEYFKKDKKEFHKLSIYFLLSVIIISVFIFGFGAYIHKIYEDNILQVLLLFIEIISISLAVGKNKESRILKLSVVFAFWFFNAIFSFSLLGFFEQYLDYQSLDTNENRLLYSAIFFHLFNACFLFYSLLPKNLKR